MHWYKSQDHYHSMPKECDSWFYKYDTANGQCAEICLSGPFIGACPLQVVVSLGELSEGKCKNAHGEAKPLMVRAGPCGMLMFSEVSTKPPLR